MKPFNFLKNLLFFKEPTSKKYTKVVWVDSFFEVPEDTGSKIFIVGTAETMKWVVFNCPDNCGRRIEVNLMKSRYPNWRLSVKGNRLSLWPSIIVDKCGAHFWMNKSQVIWSIDNS